MKNNNENIGQQAKVETEIPVLEAKIIEKKDSKWKTIGCIAAAIAAAAATVWYLTSDEENSCSIEFSGTEEAE